MDFKFKLDDFKADSDLKARQYKEFCDKIKRALNSHTDQIYARFEEEKKEFSNYLFV